MNTLDRDVSDIDDQAPVTSANNLIGYEVINQMEEDLGKIKEIMLDIKTGQIAYVVLSYGGFMGMGNKLFAVPWNEIKMNTAKERFVLNVDKARLETAAGFDKENWPDMSDPNWQEQVNTFYQTSGSAMDNMGSSTTSRGGAKLR